MDEPEKGGNVAKLLYDAAEGKYQMLVSEHTAYELLKLGVPADYINQVLRPLLLLNGSDMLVANDDILRGALKNIARKRDPFYDGPSRNIRAKKQRAARDQGPVVHHYSPPAGGHDDA